MVKNYYLYWPNWSCNWVTLEYMAFVLLKQIFLQGAKQILFFLEKISKKKKKKQKNVLQVSAQYPFHRSLLDIHLTSLNIIEVLYIRVEITTNKISSAKPSSESSHKLHQCIFIGNY